MHFKPQTVAAHTCQNYSQQHAIAEEPNSQSTTAYDESFSHTYRSELYSNPTRDHITLSYTTAVHHQDISLRVESI